MKWQAHCFSGAISKGFMMKNLAVTCMFLLISANSFASADCQKLKQELQLMQQAQQQVLKSLINNHETFASSLEEYSMAIDAAPRGAPIVAKKMNNSAEAFRTRGLQGHKTALKLTHATNDLLARVASCLK